MTALDAAEFAVLCALRDGSPLPAKVNGRVVTRSEPTGPLFVPETESRTRRVHRPVFVARCGSAFGVRLMCNAWRIGGRMTDMTHRSDGVMCLKCANATTPAAVVYRAFDRSGQLLYVGRTQNPYARMQAHANSSAWWPHAVEIAQQRFPTLAEAAQAEVQAILTEGPRYNLRAVA